MASSKGKIDQVFNDRITDQATQADAIAKSMRGEGQRPWQLPKDLKDPLDIPGITKAYDRTGIEGNYNEITTASEPGNVGDVVAVKGQGDYIAMMERAFRARHASLIRCLAHAAARRAGHGKDSGVYTGVVTAFFQRSLKAGGE